MATQDVFEQAGQHRGRIRVWSSVAIFGRLEQVVGNPREWLSARVAIDVAVELVGAREPYEQPEVQAEHAVGDGPGHVLHGDCVE